MRLWIVILTIISSQLTHPGTAVGQYITDSRGLPEVNSSFNNEPTINCQDTPEFNKTASDFGAETCHNFLYPFSFSNIKQNAVLFGRGFVWGASTIMKFQRAFKLDEKTTCLLHNISYWMALSDCLYQSNNRSRLKLSDRMISRIAMAVTLEQAIVNATGVVLGTAAVFYYIPVKIIFRGYMGAVSGLSAYAAREITAVKNLLAANPQLAVLFPKLHQILIKNGLMIVGGYFVIQQAKDMLPYIKASLSSESNRGQGLEEIASGLSSAIKNTVIVHFGDKIKDTDLAIRNKTTIPGAPDLQKERYRAYSHFHDAVQDKIEAVRDDLLREKEGLPNDSI